MSLIESAAVGALDMGNEEKRLEREKRREVGVVDGDVGEEEYALYSSFGSVECVLFNFHHVPFWVDVLEKKGSGDADERTDRPQERNVCSVDRSCCRQGSRLRVPCLVDHVALGAPMNYK